MCKHFIEGQRLILRSVLESDVTENYIQWLNDSDTNQYLESRFLTHTKESVKEFVKRIDQQSDTVFLAIVFKNDNTHIGNIKLGPIHEIHNFADIGILIGEKKYWGQGYATEAIKMLTQYAFNTLGLHKLTAGFYSNNMTSGNAFFKNGFIQEGCLKKHYYYKGAYIDGIKVGLLNKKWPALEPKEDDK